mmetsp:Transcript_21764/g.60490  ORF Transcript_21764/g.60490 Transcript_21764/m.60490 type:complete len:277 (+) Transcript_21764:224-1054(+)
MSPSEVACNADEAKKPRPSLTMMLLGDVLSAAGASFAVSPFIMGVDKAIIQNASGTDSMLSSLRKTFTEILLRPHALLRRPELYFVWGVYSATYVAANITDSMCEAAEMDATVPKFLSATAVNMGAGMAKDRALARMFGSGLPRPMAWSSFGMFAIRDALTIAASFSLPAQLAKRLQEPPNNADASVLSMGMGPTTSNVAAQLMLPMGVQFLSPPPHLLGLDIYNNPKRASTARLSFVASQLPSSTLARMGRICPAFGIGGLGNKYLRTSFRERFC